MVKKKHQHTQSKPPQFASTPFSSLKGVSVSGKPAATVETPAKIAPPAQSDEKGYDLFLQAMAGTRPLRGATPIEGVQPATGSAAAKSQPKSGVAISPEDTAAAELFIQEIGRLKLEVRFSESSAEEDELRPLSGNRLKQLKRGVITVDHQLDLHGLTRDEALAALPRFLRSARMREQTAALVITGKGLNSPGEPVLQRAIAAWLRDAGRELVLEYAPAPREMGGTGAFIVFLRPLPKPVA
ncbi:MAG: Smr/MutS family protein [Geobacteraceae bacterium]|nr:Smr/MutS family protein [Geobacteraceae bacterium]